MCCGGRLLFDLGLRSVVFPRVSVVVVFVAVPGGDSGCGLGAVGLVVVVVSCGVVGALSTSVSVCASVVFTSFSVCIFLSCVLICTVCVLEIFWRFFLFSVVVVLISFSLLIELVV